MVSVRWLLLGITPQLLYVVIFFRDSEKISNNAFDKKFSNHVLGLKNFWCFFHLLEHCHIENFIFFFFWLALVTFIYPVNSH